MGWHKLLSVSLMGQQWGQNEQSSLHTLGRPAVKQGMFCRPRKNTSNRVCGGGVYSEYRVFLQLGFDKLLTRQKRPSEASRLVESLVEKLLTRAGSPYCSWDRASVKPGNASR